MFFFFGRMHSDKVLHLGKKFCHTFPNGAPVHVFVIESSSKKLCSSVWKVDHIVECKSLAYHRRDSSSRGVAGQHSTTKIFLKLHLWLWWWYRWCWCSKSRTDVLVLCARSLLVSARRLHQEQQKQQHFPLETPTGRHTGRKKRCTQHADLDQRR